MTLTQDEHNDLLRLLAIAETCMLAHAYPVAWGGQIDMARKVIRGAEIAAPKKARGYLPARHPDYAGAMTQKMSMPICDHCAGVHPLGCCAQDGHGG